MTDLPDILTPEQVAEYLQLPADVVIDYLEQRKMPGVKIGNAWRIRRATLDQWLDQQSLSAVSEHQTPPGETPDATSDETSLIPQIAEARSEQVTDRPVSLQTEQLPTAAEKDKESQSSEGFANADQASPDERTTIAKTPTKSIAQKPTTSQRATTQPPKRILGKVKSFNPKTGYGFIVADDGREVFVHAVDVENYGQYLRSGHRVEFDIRRVPKGWQAYDVVIVSKKAQSDPISAPAVQSRPAPVISKKAQIAFEQALAARELGDFKRARELFEEAIRQGPFLNVFQAYAAMEEKENPQNAIRVLEKGIQLFPDAGILYNDYAMLKRRQGDLQSAASILRQGLSAAPAFERQFHSSLANILYELGGEENLAEAAAHQKQAESLGQPPPTESKWYIELNILTGPRIGREAYYFFQKAGFQVKPSSYSRQSADLLVSSDLPEYLETYGLQDRILVRCFYSPVNLSHLNAIQDVLRNPPPRLKGLNQDIAFLVLEDVLPLKDALYRLMGENREAIVPIDSLSLEVSHSEEAPKILRHILDQWLSRRDLYRYNYPVSGRRFFGRELDLQRLIRDIDDGHNVGIFGLRKVGKTSLLHQLRELRTQDLTVYLDIQAIPSDSQDCAYLYWAIARKLQEECAAKKDTLGAALANISFRLGSQSAPQFQKRTGRLFDHDIHAVLDRLEQNRMSTRLVLILDEVDRLLPVSGKSPGFQGYADFFAYLRGVSQTSRGRFVTIITAANPALCEQAMWEGRDNPVFQFYHLMFLPPLTREDCNDMVVKLGRGMGISYSEESLDAIFRATSGHPYITRLLCSHINQLNPSRPLQVTREMVFRARSEFLRGEATSVFDEILERLDTYFPIERDLLLFIADGVDDEIELSNLVNQPVDLALYHLIGYQLVEQMEGKYRIKIDMFHEWLLRHRLGRTRNL